MTLYQATKDDPEGVDRPITPDAIGIKTGFTAAAGHCFVGAAERDGVELISVVFYTTADPAAGPIRSKADGIRLLPVRRA